MRILVLALGDAETWDSWSGSSKSIVDHLRAAGHTVVCRDADLTGLPRFTTALRSFAPRRRRWWVRYHLGATGFAARSRKADAILRELSGGFDAVLQIGATFKVSPPAGIPTVLYCDSNIEQAGDGAESGFSDANMLDPRTLQEVRAREHEVYRAAARIFTMSERLRRSFVERFGIPGERVETIHAGPNFERGSWPVVPARAADRDPVVLFIGRDFHRKGGDLLLAAFARVRQAVPKATLIVIGPDQLPEGMERAPEGVEWLGYVNKQTEAGRAALFDAYARARVFCLPTRFEPFGIVYLEAMHYELPCVGPRAWAVPEIIEDGVTGLLVPPENRDALADALIRLLTDPERAHRMGLAGKERLQRSFTWERTAGRMAASLARLIPGRG